METSAIMQRAAIIAIAAAMVPTLAFGERRGRDRDDDRDCDFTIVALTSDQTLAHLRGCEPRYPRVVRGISGFTGSDTALVGIDYRVQDGKLYGVGNAGGIYEIDPSSGIATKSRQLTVALQGTSFGVDFNPAANALRIVSNTGQNLRHPFADPAAATATDGALNYTAGTAVAGVNGAAYINNDLVPETGTLLFDIDTTLNQLSIQLPPNAGTLTAVGALGLDPDGSIGFDIHSKTRQGATTQNTGFASMSVNGLTALYRINLLTGKANRIDVITASVIDIAIPIEQD